ncbi:hypothetical protein [Pseudomonas viridiflava]|uniref:hypothetical protein n=1 Tax=Pseudomonas viridiflava TaxID=33069 RepID=UPI001C315CE1|nr:hypothetical protein [Pseudomonas viridiflava]QXG47476.1 hypothetical protein KTT57_28685 [Pseudomonas viridiflava]
MSDKDNLPVIQPASALDLKLPEPPEHVRPATAEKIQQAIAQHGAYTSSGEVLVNAKGLPTLLQTDRAGANLVMANLPSDQIIEDGKNLLVKAAPLNQELSRRIQEPRNAGQHEALKYSEACLISLRDNPALERTRVVLEAHNRQDMSAAKKTVRKQATQCLSGEPLKPGAHVHHVERVADQPRKSADPSNMVAVNTGPHNTIHREEAHTPAAVNELAEQLGWPGRVPAPSSETPSQKASTADETATSREGSKEKPDKAE